MAVVSGSCLRDPYVGRPEGVDPGNGTSSEVTISLKMPAVNNTATRALSAADESNVETADIFVFDSGGILCDRGYGAQITDVSTGGEVVKKFSTRLRKGTGRKIMFLFNSRDAILAAFPNGVAIGATTEAELTDAVHVSIPQAGWNSTAGSAGYRPIPMWGVKTGVTIDESTSLSLKAVRMLARVNVSLVQGAQGIAPDKFRLGSVYVYNGNAEGSAIPDASKGSWTAATPKASLPSIPAGCGTLNRVLYELPGNNSAGATGLMQTIYIAEADKGVPFGVSATGFMKNTCIVIGGWYAGSTRQTYYRVDFMVKDGTGAVSYLDILRNHSYNVIVQTVGGPGKDTPDDAFNSLPENINAGVVVWNDSDISNIKFDGVNMLSVSQGEFGFSKGAGRLDDTDNTIKITTDVAQVGTTPGGWTANIFDDEAGTVPLTGNWLRMTDLSGVANSAGPYNYPTGEYRKLMVDKNTGADARTAYIHIKAGRLTYVVKVVQSTTPHYNLEIWRNANYAYGAGGDDYYQTSELDVPSDIAQGQHRAYDFTLKWHPEDAMVHYSIMERAASGSEVYDLAGNILLPSGRYIVNHAGGSYTDTYSNLTYNGIRLGERYFDIRGNYFDLDKNDPFAEKSAVIEFSMLTDSGIITKSLTVRQKKDNIRLAADDYYLMDGTTEHKITVKSNFLWKVKILAGTAGDPKGVVKEFGVQTGGGNGYREDLIRFTLHDNISNPDMNKLESTIHFVFERLNEHGQWVAWNDWNADGSEKAQQEVYSVKCVAAKKVGHANSYLVKPGGTPIMIPLSIAKEAYQNFGVTTLGAGDMFSPKFVWSDHTTTREAGKVKSGVIRDMIAVGGNAGSADINGDGTGDGGYNGWLIVIPGNVEGNAVVAVQNDTQQSLGWSWHIWNTGYDPDAANKNGDVYNFNGFEWMDRNIGAGRAKLDATGDTDNDFFGFYYQHGRKDPFPGPKVVSTTPLLGMLNVKLVDIYDWNGNPLPFTGAGGMQMPGNAPSGSTGAEVLSTSIRNPLTYYSHNTAEAAWSTEGFYDWAWWGHSTGKKGLFDPCPEGWRIPYAAESASGRDAPTFPWRGITANMVTHTWHSSRVEGRGYWPRAGWLHDSYHSLDIGPVDEFNRAHYWLGSKYGTWGHRFEWDGGATDMGGDFAGDHQDFGFSVRCVRDK